MNRERNVCTGAFRPLKDSWQGGWCSQTSVPRACATVHLPGWQFWDKFINSCYRRLSYSGISPSRHFLIKAKPEEAKKHFAAQKTLCYSFISQFIYNLNDCGTQQILFDCQVWFRFFLTQFVWVMFTENYIFSYIPFTGKASNHTHSQEICRGNNTSLLYSKNWWHITFTALGHVPNSFIFFLS